MIDSTTSEGWLRKSNFIEDGKDHIQATIRLEVACLHATHYLSTGIREYSQWFCGADNNVAGALSWDSNRADNKLTQSASAALRNCSTAEQDCLMADLASAMAARQTAVG